MLVPIDVRPVDSRFNDNFWQQFVFNQHDDPNPNRDARFSRVLDQNPSPNVYIRMGNPTGRRVVSNQQRDHIQRAVPQLVQQLTGEVPRLVRPCVQLVVDWVKECSR